VFRKIIVHHQEEFCTNSLQYLTMRLMRRIVADTIQVILIIRILPMMNNYLFETCRR